MVEYTTGEGGLSEQVFRHCAPAHSDLDHTLERAKALGGRYNPPGEFGAIYVSRTREGALRELDRRMEKLGLRSGDLLPRTLLTIDLHAQKILDLTDEGVRAAWGADIEDLIDEDEYSRCHEVARSARRAGYEAIRFPAFDGKGVNYAVFLDRLQPGSRLQIVSEERLDDA